MSWISYLALALFGVLATVLGWGIWIAFHQRHHARWERLIRFLGVAFLFGAITEVAVWLDWATSYPLVHRFGRTVWGAPQSTSDKLMYTFFGLFGLAMVCLIIAGFKRRRRLNRATDDFLKTKIALKAEYGGEEAERIAERTGLERKWKDEFHDV